MAVAIQKRHWKSGKFLLVHLLVCREFTHIQTPWVIGKIKASPTSFVSCARKF